MNDDDVTYLGRVDFRNDRRRFGIRRADRRHHMYMIGRTGTGKSTLMKTMVLQDLWRGEGGALFDPHGDLAEAIRREAPKKANVKHLDASVAGSFAFNPFADVPPERRPLAAAGIVEVFQKIWSDDWGPRLEHLLRNVVYTLLDSPGSSFADIPRLLTDRDERRRLVALCSNQEVRAFWKTEYERYSPGFRSVVTAPLQNKVGAILTDPGLRAILCAPKSTIGLRQAMETGEFMVFSLPKGRIGDGPSSLLGSLLVSHLAVSGLGRADVAENVRRDFCLYLDEFHAFATLSLATMLSELRKFRVSLTLAHQYLGQLLPAVRDAVFGNVATVVAFRISAQDSGIVSKELGDTLSPADLSQRPNHQVYIRLLVDGAPSRPFSASSLSYRQAPLSSHSDAVVRSQDRGGRRLPNNSARIPLRGRTQPTTVLAWTTQAYPP